MSYHLKPKYTSHRLLQNGMRTSTSKWMMMFTLISVSFHKPFSCQEKLYSNSVIIQECLVLHWLATDQNRECTLGAWSLDLSLLKSKQQSLSQAHVFFYTDHWLFFPGSSCVQRSQVPWAGILEVRWRRKQVLQTCHWTNLCRLQRLSNLYLSKPVSSLTSDSLLSASQTC